jgi:preprotein translocase subunit SecG
MAMAVLFFGCALGIHILNRGASEGGGTISINSPADSE